MKPMLVAAAISAFAATGTGGWWLAVRSGALPMRVARAEIAADTMMLVGDSIRIKVEVLNASGERGLARRATSYLRDRGFDVVGAGNSDKKADSSVVIDRSGHPEWAAVVARALGGARIESHPDSSRYLDFTILLGSAFRSPSQILYP